MATKDVASLLTKEFVIVRLDFDRAKGAKEIELRYVEKEQGLPWFAFLDGDGKAIATSLGPKGNIGHPNQPEEVEHFQGMLQKAKRHLTDAEIATLITSLKEFNTAANVKK
jgi:hypothetical protein